MRSTASFSKMELRVQQPGQLFLDHASRPRNFGKATEKGQQAYGFFGIPFIVSRMKKMIEVISAFSYKCTKFEDDALLRDTIF